jgi:hypothetical protein
MRITYQFEMAAGLCTLELDIRVHNNQFCVQACGYESPNGTGIRMEEALLDFANNFKKASAADLIDGKVFRNLPWSGAPES